MSFPDCFNVIVVWEAPRHCGRHRLNDIRTISSFPRSLKTFRWTEHEGEDRFALSLDHWRSCLAPTSHCLHWQEAPSLSTAATLMIRPTQRVTVATAPGGEGDAGGCWGAAAAGIVWRDPHVATVTTQLSSASFIPNTWSELELSVISHDLQQQVPSAQLSLIWSLGATPRVQWEWEVFKMFHNSVQ